MYDISLVNLPCTVNWPKTAFMPLPLLILGTCLNNIKAKNKDLKISYDVLDLALLLNQGFLKDTPNFHKDAAKTLAKKKSDAYFFTTHGDNISAVIQTASELKKHLSNCLIVIGGVSATLSSKSIFLAPEPY